MHSVYRWFMLKNLSTSRKPAAPAADPAFPAVTDTLVFDVVKRSGIDFGTVASVLCATRTHLNEAASA